MEKRLVLDLLIKMQKEKIERLRKSYEKTREAAVDAPGSNVSRSDTSKFQFSNLALGIQKRIGEAESVLELIENTEPTESEFIMAGTFFSLKNTTSGEIFNYFLVCEGGGGELVKVENKEIKFISEGAPIAFSVKGREKGEKINFRDKTFEIIEVQ